MYLFPAIHVRTSSNPVPRYHQWHQWRNVDAYISFKHTRQGARPSRGRNHRIADLHWSLHQCTFSSFTLIIMFTHHKGVLYGRVKLLPARSTGQSYTSNRQAASRLRFVVLQADHKSSCYQGFTQNFAFVRGVPVPFPKLLSSYSSSTKVNTWKLPKHVYAARMSFLSSNQQCQSNKRAIIT